jgi:YD repeat-containing protein
MISKTILKYKYQIFKIIDKSDKNDHENVQSNTYDASGNLLTHEATMGSIKFREEYKYENNIRVEGKSYTIPASEEVFLDIVTKYDEQFNIVEMSFYEKSALKRTLSYTYKFDGYGNWIEKRTYVNNDPANSKTGIPYLIETREITYW